MPHFVTRCSDVPITNLSFGVWIPIPLLPFEININSHRYGIPGAKGELGP